MSKSGKVEEKRFCHCQEGNLRIEREYDLKDRQFEGETIFFENFGINLGYQRDDLWYPRSVSNQICWNFVSDKLVLYAFNHICIELYALVFIVRFYCSAEIYKQSQH